jgi:chromosome segregation ATPase
VVSNENFTVAKERARKAANDYGEIKRKRANRFNEAFQIISQNLKTIYKDLTRSR